MRQTNIWSQALSITTCLLCFVDRGSSSQSIDVALRTSFPSPPFLLELLETAAEENQTCYYPLLDRVADGAFDGAASDKELYEVFLEVLKQDGHITDGPTLSSFKYALALHSAAPRITAQYQSYETLFGVGEDCTHWVFLDGKGYCSPSLSEADYEIKTGLRVPSRFSFDRTLGRAGLPASILYTDLTDKSFGHFHKTLLRTAKEGKSSYTVRYRPSPPKEDKGDLFVSGYGVEMALKKTDYIVIDDREVSSQEDTPEKTEGSTIEFESEEDISDLQPLSASELKRLGVKAASFVLSSSDPLDTLVKLSQDFPKYSAAITSHNISQTFLTELEKNRDAYLQPGTNQLWINGIEIEERHVDAFALLENLRKERKLVASLSAIGITGPEAIKLLSHPTIKESMFKDDPQRYDWRDELDGGDVISWLNDIEKDSRYKDWHSGLGAIMQRTYPGQLPSVRRNIHHLVFPIDFSDITDVQILIGTIQTLIKRTVPVRFGLVPLTRTAAATLQAKVALHILQTYGIGVLFEYLELAVQKKAVLKAEKSVFESATNDRTIKRDQVSLSLESVMTSEDFDTRIEHARSYLARLGLDENAPPLLANGVPVARSEQWLSVMSQRVTTDLRTLQRAIYQDQFTEDMWLPDHFLETASKQRNVIVVPEDESSINIIDLSRLLQDHTSSFEMLPQIHTKEGEQQSDWAHLIVVGDFDTPAGRSLLRNAATFVKQHASIEMVIVNNRAVSTVDTPTSDFLWQVSRQPSFSVDTILEMPDPAALRSENSESHQVESTSWNIEDSLAQDLGLGPGQQGLLLNGRLVGPIPAGSKFGLDDFDFLLTYERSKRLNAIYKAVDRLSLFDRLQNPFALARLSSIMVLSTIPETPAGMFEGPPPARHDDFISWASEHSAILSGDSKTSGIQVVATIDPAGEVAQRWLPILKVLGQLDGVFMKLFLNPVERLEELPIKRFYRYVLSSQPSFDENGQLDHASARFTGIQKDALLTMGMDVPPAWLVMPKISVHDLDNIKLSTIKDGLGIQALYELEHILIEGHAREQGKTSPPRGAQLVLGTEVDFHTADTIVMANLGYFQFKANPGAWKLNLQEGRTQEVFKLESAGTNGYKARPGDNHTDFVLTSFQGKTLFPRLSRRPGQQEEDVLESSSSIMGGKAMEFVSKSTKFASDTLASFGLVKSVQPQHADINIFSVASGHLYERMLNIMMVSVMRHTKHTVKFWFIENFLSPSFKDFIPIMAAEYGFQYELVTFKWPHWLRAQSEKQREIWGYKILFLDVLFPLSLKKVIFVDADQIVRTDMYDLVEHDLEGAPYGFTPMCDSRVEMEGFRFWKTGYWADFLHGRPYHISALYVVDLAHFRAIAAGDRLRQQYHQLSADPNSLSNLDQDLPNHMQHALPIHSLPQSWLWCETWCSDEELADARTIDLCNNPQTKEPKLDRARRQVPEWTEYDDEIESIRKSRLVERTDGEKNTKSRAQSRTPSSRKDEL